MRSIYLMILMFLVFNISSSFSIWNSYDTLNEVYEKRNDNIVNNIRKVNLKSFEEFIFINKQEYEIFQCKVKKSKKFIPFAAIRNNRLDIINSLIEKKMFNPKFETKKGKNIFTCSLSDFCYYTFINIETVKYAYDFVKPNLCNKIKNYSNAFELLISPVSCYSIPEFLKANSNKNQKMFQMLKCFSNGSKNLTLQSVKDIITKLEKKEKKLFGYEQKVQKYDDIKKFFTDLLEEKKLSLK